MEAACASRRSFHDLLAKLAEVSAPSAGCASILMAFGRLASAACDWVDGDLAIELLDVDDATEIRIMTELGGGMREALFPPLRVRAPLKELTAALDDRPSLVGALRVHRRSWKRVTLDATEGVRRLTTPPRISEASLLASRPPPSTSAAANEVRADAPRDASADIDASWDDVFDEPR